MVALALTRVAAEVAALGAQAAQGHTSLKALLALVWLIPSLARLSPMPKVVKVETTGLGWLATVAGLPEQQRVRQTLAAAAAAVLVKMVLAALAVRVL